MRQKAGVGVLGQGKKLRRKGLLRIVLRSPTSDRRLPHMNDARENSFRELLIVYFDDFDDEAEDCLVVVGEEEEEEEEEEDREEA